MKMVEDWATYGWPFFVPFFNDCKFCSGMEVINILDFDITELLRTKLERDNRPPDGRLHPSGDLLGSLRHSQLRAAGAPSVEGDVVSSVRLQTGTMWHSYFETAFRGRPVMTEVKLDKWLPEGWSGTADWIIWNDELQGFVLGDLKTTKGEGIKWIHSKGIKEEHQWQVSSYWWALYNMGLPMVNGYVVYYLPMNQVIEKGKFADVHPVVMEGKPLKSEVIHPAMAERWVQTEKYLDEVRKNRADSLKNFSMWDPWEKMSDLLTESLAPVQDRVQKLMKNRAHPEQTDVVLVPHWSAAYCPFPDELCDCNTHGTTKIGYYEDGEYHPRKGYENYEPIHCAS